MGKIIVFTIYLTSISVFCMISSCAPAECVIHSDCAPGNVCVDNRCFIDCSGERDCPDGHYCVSGACLPNECYKGVCHEGYENPDSEYEAADIDGYESGLSEGALKITDEKFPGGNEKIEIEIPESEEDTDETDDALKITDEKFPGGNEKIEIEIPESEKETDETDDAIKISDEKFSGKDRKLKIEPPESEDETDKIMNYNNNEEHSGNLSIYKSLNCFASVDFKFGMKFNFRTGGQR
ncbi:MAG: hypothetical protein R6W70_03615 [bacterium]